MDILIIGMVGLGAVYILKNPQILQGQPAAPAAEPVAETPVEPVVEETPAPAASQITCSDGSVIASTETCPEVAADATPEEEDEDDDNEDDNDDDDEPKTYGGGTKTKSQAQSDLRARAKAKQAITSASKKKAIAQKPKPKLVSRFKTSFARIDEDDYTPLNWG